jgi:hypothetical protein
MRGCPFDPASGQASAIFSHVSVPENSLAKFASRMPHPGSAGPAYAAAWCLQSHRARPGRRTCILLVAPNPVCARRFFDTWYRRSDTKRSSSYLPSRQRSCDLLTSGRRITQETANFPMPSCVEILPRHLFARLGREIALVQAVSCPNPVRHQSVSGKKAPAVSLRFDTRNFAQGTQQDHP